jgi:beta-lactam-binding protein with PASTA domain
VYKRPAGSCTLTASQAGDAHYSAAPDVSHAFAIARQPCTVPKVVGKSLPAAKTALAKKGCRTGKVGRAYSNRVKTGRVISQNRRAGRTVAAGSKVNLVLSRGRKR